jgi:hypothetical protein
MPRGTRARNRARNSDPPIVTSAAPIALPPGVPARFDRLDSGGSNGAHVRPLFMRGGVTTQTASGSPPATRGVVGVGLRIRKE